MRTVFDDELVGRDESVELFSRGSARLLGAVELVLPYALATGSVSDVENLLDRRHMAGQPRGRTILCECGAHVRRSCWGPTS